MARLDIALETVFCYPQNFGLEFFMPEPRRDAPNHPLTARRATQDGDDLVLRYNKARGCLIQADVLWHQESNVLVLVTERISDYKCRVRGLTLPDTKEEAEAFARSGGKGTYCCIAQGWLSTWKVPKRYEMPEIVDTSNPDAFDLFPNSRRFNRYGWGSQGLMTLDENRMSARQREYLGRQMAAFRKLGESFSVEDETTALPQPGELEPGEVRFDVIPFEEGE